MKLSHARRMLGWKTVQGKLKSMNRNKTRLRAFEGAGSIPVWLALVKGDNCLESSASLNYLNFNCMWWRILWRILKSHHKICIRELWLQFHCGEWLGDESDFIKESISRRGLGKGKSRTLLERQWRCRGVDAHKCGDAGKRKASMMLRFLVGATGRRSNVLEGDNDFYVFGHVGLKWEMGSKCLKVRSKMWRWGWEIQSHCQVLMGTNAFVKDEERWEKVSWTECS